MYRKQEPVGQSVVDMEKEEDDSEGETDKERVSYDEIDMEIEENSTEHNEAMVSKGFINDIFVSLTPICLIILIVISVHWSKKTRTL